MKVYCWCGEYIDTLKDLHRLSFYKVKTPTIKRTPKGERVIDEFFYSYVCPKCERDVVLIKRKALNSIGERKALIPVKLIGLEAVEYLQETEHNRVNKTNELCYMTKPYSKVIDLSYFKALNDHTQRPRYLNETAFSGDKVVTEPILIK